MFSKLIERVLGQKRRDMAPLSYPWLFDLTLECHGQQHCPYEVIDKVGRVNFKLHLAKCLTNVFLCIQPIRVEVDGKTF